MTAMGLDNPNSLLGAVYAVVAPLEGLLLLTALCSVRMMAAMLLLPATGDQFLQGFTRAGLVVILAGFVAFGQPLVQLDDFTSVQWAGLLAKEALMGAVIGFGAATVFWTAECVGALIDNQTGYNNVQINNPLSGQSSTPVSSLLLQLAVGVFYILGGLLVFVGALFESYKLWPLLSPLPSLVGAKEILVVQQTDHLLTATLKFAAPVMLILLLIDLGFGLITRAASKLEPSSLSQPVKGAVSVLLLALLVGVFIEQVRRYLVPTGLLDQLKNAFVP
jgi:type III secretion protein T